MSSYSISANIQEFNNLHLENQHLNRSAFIFSELNLILIYAFIFLGAFIASQVQESPYIELGSFLCFFVCIL